MASEEMAKTNGADTAPSVSAPEDVAIGVEQRASNTVNGGGSQETVLAEEEPSWKRAGGDADKRAAQERRTKAARMLALFYAMPGARANRYTPVMSAPNAEGKVYPEVDEVCRVATAEHMMEHLSGVRGYGAGLSPLGSELVTFAALDLDDYLGSEINYSDVCRRVRKLDLPLVPYGTKSGGMRLALFTTAPVSKDASNAALSGAAKALGLRVKRKDNDPGGTEILVGRNIWLPYCGTRCPGYEIVDAPRRERSYRLTGLSKWLDIAEKSRATPAQLTKMAALKASKEDDEEDTGEADADAAAKRLRKFCDEIAELKDGRQSELNSALFQMGADIRKGLIDEETVWREILAAARACQYRRGPGDGYQGDEITRRQFEHSLKAGIARARGRVQDAGGKAEEPVVTEDSAALHFVYQYIDDLRYDREAGAWYRWTGTHWRRDRTAVAFAWARDLARELAKTQSPKGRYITSKVSFAANVERFAQCDQRIAVTQDCWDTDPWLLGTPGGTVDLRTGKLREAQPEDMITKQTAVAPWETADCPLWKQFLKEATRDDDDFAEFLQIMCGYALTGDTSEEMLIFVHGPGGNGKGVFLGAVANAMGSYAVEAAMDTFTESRSDRHPTDLAMLRGARLVSCAETTEGRAWAETRIKQLTGRDPVTARFMRQDFFTYVPTFKIVIVGNHQPKLHNVNDAMKRRLAMAPFIYKPSEPDTRLKDKLAGEHGGILRWMIDGCLKWQEKGLVRPQAVQDATESYFADQDLFGQWNAQCLEAMPSGAGAKGTASRRLYDSWTRFAVAAGEEGGSTVRFTELMRAHGFEAVKDRNGSNLWIGVRLAPGARRYSETEEV